MIVPTSLQFILMTNNPMLSLLAEDVKHLHLHSESQYLLLSPCSEHNYKSNYSMFFYFWPKATYSSLFMFDVYLVPVCLLDNPFVLYWIPSIVMSVPFFIKITCHGGEMIFGNHYWFANALGPQCILINDNLSP